LAVFDGLLIETAGLGKGFYPLNNGRWTKFSVDHLFDEGLVFFGQLKAVSFQTPTALSFLANQIGF